MSLTRVKNITADTTVTGDVNITGTTTTVGTVNVGGGNLSVNPTSEAAHRYLFLNAGATNDGHILFQRAGAPKFQISADTNGHLFTWNYAKNGTSFRVNTDGSVITPHQPAFLAYGSNSYVNRGFGTPVDYSSATYNEGNHYSTSTYRFTAPHAGLYHFAAGAIAHQSSTGSGGIMICHNGGNTARSYQETGSRSRNCSVTLKLAANDLVDVRIEGGGGADYYYLGGGYGYFSGYLVG